VGRLTPLWPRIPTKGLDRTDDPARAAQMAYPLHFRTPGPKLAGAKSRLPVLLTPFPQDRVTVPDEPLDRRLAAGADGAEWRFLLCSLERFATSAAEGSTRPWASSVTARRTFCIETFAGVSGRPQQQVAARP
jgi:hypothetical protein